MVLIEKEAPPKTEPSSESQPCTCTPPALAKLGQSDFVYVTWLIFNNISKIRIRYN